MSETVTPAWKNPVTLMSVPHGVGEEVQAAAEDGLGGRDPGACRLVDADAARAARVAGQVEAVDAAHERVGPRGADLARLADDAVGRDEVRLLPQRPAGGGHHLLDVLPQLGELAVVV